jgi:hypothetical protein
VADTVCHGYNGQTEGNGNAKESKGSTGENGGTATAKHQNECAEQFGEEFVTCFHNVLNFN